LREDGEAEGAGFVASLRGLLDREDDFALGHGLLAFGDYTLVGQGVIVKHERRLGKKPRVGFYAVRGRTAGGIRRISGAGGVGLGLGGGVSFGVAAWRGVLW